MKRIALPAVFGLLAVTSWVQSQTVSSINGVVYSDYAYNLENHDQALKDVNEFTIRRIYFTFENNLTEKIKMRFRLESAHGKYGETEKINPFVKHAYLEWTDFLPSHKLYLGIAETNAFKNAENYWGYRSIEKTIMDLNKISSSADMGIALKGDLGMYLHHWLTVFNGTGYGSSEVDKYKKIGYAFWVTPVEGLILEGYVDYEKQDPDNGTFSGAKDYFQGSGYTTVKGFVGYSGMSFTLGAETFVRTNKQSGATDAVGTGRTDVKKQGYSLFGSWITPLPKTKVFARYDSYDPNTGDNVFVSGTKNGMHDEYSLIIAGFDFIPRGNIHFMPNIMIKNYSDPDRKNDVTARLTLYYKFDTGKITI
ncbi:hypothetical protein JXO52_00940 [bacterium]|nr:hypothetical protein [bacterium]